MGRFDGLLLLSDYDDTLVYSSEALRTGTGHPPVPPRNLEAIRDFMAEGGLFAVATGRPLVSFRPFADRVPMNAPAVVNGGAALYDFAKGTYLRSFFLPKDAPADLQPYFDQFPLASAEAFHLGDEVEVVRPNDWTAAHIRLTQVNAREVPSLSEVGPQATKLLFEGDPALMGEMEAYLLEKGLGERYEIVSSNAHLLEITGKGVHKGRMVLELAALLGIERENVCCAGDQSIDISMLRSAGRAFAPSNAIEAVRALPGITVVGHCQDGAIADIVDILSKRPAYTACL